MRRKSSKLVLISAGAALAWFLDPVSGRDRRRQVTEKVSGLTGGSPPSDPTGGAFPSAVADVQPAAAPSGDALLDGQPIWGDGEPSPPDLAGDDADSNRAALRATW